MEKKKPKKNRQYDAIALKEFNEMCTIRPKLNLGYSFYSHQIPSHKIY